MNHFELELETKQGNNSPAEYREDNITKNINIYGGNYNETIHGNYYQSRVGRVISFLNKNQFKLLGGIVTLLIIFYIVLSPLSNYLTKLGLEYVEKNNEKALFFLELALKFDNNNDKAMTNIGYIYEKRQQYDNAHEYYQKARLKNNIAACNNEARLNLTGKRKLSQGNFAKAELQENFAEAENLLENSCLKFLDDLEQSNQEEKYKNAYYAIYTNLGWAQFLQNNYLNAENNLQQAIDMLPEKGTANCLLAETLAAIGNNFEIVTESERCIAYANPSNPEEKQWIHNAQERIFDAESNSLNALGKGFPQRSEKIIKILRHSS